MSGEDSTTTSVVKTKLRSAVNPSFGPLFIETIEKLVLILSKIALEGYLVANFHILRCLVENLSLPGLYHTFFYRCCTQNAGQKNKEDKDLKETLLRYKMIRDSTGCEPIDSKFTNLFVSTLSSQMETSTFNHLRLNFPERVERYVRLRYGIAKSQAERFVRGAVQGEGKDRVDTQKELNEWLEGANPYYSGDWTGSQLHFLIKKTYEIMQFIQGLPKDTKGAKTFSLLPHKKDFQLSHMVICKSHIRQFVKHIGSKDDRTRILDDLLARVTSEEEEAFQLLSEACVDDDFSDKLLANAWVTKTLWNVFLNYGQFETKPKEFAYRISTNGYEICLSYTKATKPSKKRKLKAPELSDFDSFIGLDPGRNYLFTGYSEEVDSRDRHRTSRLSGGEYRHRSQQTAARIWNENLKARFDAYSQIIQDVPTLKTTKVDELTKGIAYRLKHCDTLFAFSAEQSFRKWRFKSYRFTRKALSDAAKTLVKGCPRACIGLGDWSQQDGVKGSPHVPLRAFKRALQEHAAMVIDIDEFRTSKSCSRDECEGIVYHPLWSAKKKKKKKKRRKRGDGVVEEVAAVVESMVEEVAAVVESKRFPVHEVVKCSTCSTFWQRDVNAARNIHRLLIFQLSGMERPVRFRRAKAGEEQPHLGRT